jgi:type II secretory pathway component PulJ
LKKQNTYLKGGTILEVLIALAITSFCVTMAIIIYLNIQKSSLPFFKLKAIELAGYYMEKTIQQHNFEEETFKAEEFTVKKFVSRNAEFMDCYTIRMVVFDGTKKKLLELESTIYSNK